MPWEERDKVELRRLLVEAVVSGRLSMSAACKEFGVSRPTGYKWRKRYEEEGLKGLEDRSRCPHGVSSSVDPVVAAAVLADREAHPTWGARKIRKRLSWGDGEVPSERTVHRIIKRAGLVEPQGSKPEEPKRFARSRPNELWQMDHKSAIHGCWSRRAVPFVVLDDCTRYLIGLKALPDKGLASTWGSLWEMLGEFGLPEAILSDNDSIFHGLQGPSQLEVRLMRLGIKILHGRPYHPQTQGKVERLNATLEIDLLRNGSFGSAEELQAGFDGFRYDYNFERPNEAIGMDVPGRIYRPSDRQRPSVLPEMEYATGLVLRKVHKDGWISWGGYRISVGVGLNKELVEVRDSDTEIEIYYGPYRLKGAQIANLRRLK